MSKENINIEETAIEIAKNDALADIREAGTNDIYASFDITTMEGKKRFFNATSNSDVALKEAANKTINVVDICIQPQQMVRKETGEYYDAWKVVLIDDAGVSYYAVSIGVYNTLKDIIRLCGLPDSWEEPVAMMPIIVSSNGNNITKLKLV